MYRLVRETKQGIGGVHSGLVGQHRTAPKPGGTVQQIEPVVGVVRTPGGVLQRTEPPEVDVRARGDETVSRAVVFHPRLGQTGPAQPRTQPGNANLHRTSGAGVLMVCPYRTGQAQVRARGGAVVSVDPVYTVPPAELMAQVRQDIERTYAWAATQDATVNWSYLGSAEAMRWTFEVGADLFAMDYTPGGDWYVAAGLPHLPFPDRHFSGRCAARRRLIRRTSDTRRSRQRLAATLSFGHRGKHRIGSGIRPTRGNPDD